MKKEFGFNERPFVRVWSYDSNLNEEVELVGEVLWVDGMFMKVSFTDGFKIIDVRETKYELL